MVWITERGHAFHRRPTCEALLAGQGRTERRGQRTHEPRNVAYSDAIADGRGPCLQCFPEQIPAEAKPCWVRVENRSMKGWLLDWSRGNDHRWKGKVIYIDMGRGMQVTTVKDQSDLEDRAPGTNDQDLLDAEWAPRSMHMRHAVGAPDHKSDCKSDCGMCGPLTAQQE